MPAGETATDTAPPKSAPVTTAEHVASAATTLLSEEANGKHSQESEKAKTSSDALGA